MVRAIGTTSKVLEPAMPVEGNISVRALKSMQGKAQDECCHSLAKLREVFSEGVLRRRFPEGA